MNRPTQRPCALCWEYASSTPLHFVALPDAIPEALHPGDKVLCCLQAHCLDDKELYCYKELYRLQAHRLVDKELYCTQGLVDEMLCCLQARRLQM